MTQHIHLDAVGGIAGDMFVAALLDALPALHDRVFQDLDAARPSGRRLPGLSAGSSGGIRALRFLIDDGKTQDTGHRHRHRAGAGPQPTDHGHPDAARSDGGHRQDDSATGGHGHEPGHASSYADLAARIAAALLSAGTADVAQAILKRLASAESTVHGVPLDHVHFHEIADWDSLMDIIAAASIISSLPSATWSVSSLPIGHGFVRTRHGLLPVPAPATTELLRGFIWRSDGVEGERVTPTGAAIMAYLSPIAGEPGDMTLRAVGTGAGSREYAQFPNVLRALVFERHPPESATTYRDRVVLIHFDVDDMTGEEIGVAAERLRTLEGVLDVSLAPRQGKKHRPAMEFRVMLAPDRLDIVSAACFHETSTLGLRWREESRMCLRREKTVGHLGDVTLHGKRAFRPDGSASLKIESDDIARFDGLSARRVASEAGKETGEPT